MSSRRQRRKGIPAGKGKWLWRGIGGALAFGTLVAGGGYIWVRNWLHGAEFRQTLAQNAAQTVEASSAEFGEFHWSGTHLATPSFSARGEKLVEDIEAQGLEVDIGLGALWRRVLRIDSARLRSIVVRLDATAADERKESAGDDSPKKAPAKSWYESLIPQELELGGLEVDSSALNVTTRSGTVAVSGTAWRVEPDQIKGSYKAEGSGGKLKLPWTWAPVLQLGRARLRYQDDSLFLTRADFQVYHGGTLQLAGEMSTKGEGYSFDGKLEHIDGAEVLPADWKKHLTGGVESEFSVTKGAAGPRVRGSLRLSDAVLTALPLLDTLSAYADTTRFRRLALQEGSADFQWEDGTLSLSKLVISSEGLVRLEGALKIADDGGLEGLFRLGLVPGVLSHIPGAETDVFVPGERGLLWTTLRIGGTREHPTEDLSDRLIDAAGARMFELLPETGQKVLKFSGRMAGDLAGQVRESAKDLPGAVEKGVEQGTEILEGAGEVAKGAISIFDTLRGKEEEEEPPPDRKRERR